MWPTKPPTIGFPRSLYFQYILFWKLAAKLRLFSYVSRGRGGPDGSLSMYAISLLSAGQSRPPQLGRRISDL